MNELRLIKSSQKLLGDLSITGSKSISNRVLLLNALCTEPVVLKNLSDSDDTQLMKAALEHKKAEINVGMAGTACRFMTAFLAVQAGRKTLLTGHRRLQERPIGFLVDALRELGATISYQKEEGFLPLIIEGQKIEGGCISIPANVSSQYISALMLVASSMKNGLELSLTGNILSRPYIQMTMDLINQFGGDCTWVSEKMIAVKPSKLGLNTGSFQIESDWSSAAYWYQWMAMSEIGSSLTLKSYFKNSSQADAIASNLFKSFGVNSFFKDDCLTLEKVETEFAPWVEIDCKMFPDLAMSLAVQAICSDKSVTLRGLDNLPLKESNRLEALKAELEKFGAQISILNGNALRIQPVKEWPKSVEAIKTYHDHRMALALAPLSIKVGSLKIEDPEVVSKSYPNYWEDVKKITS